MSKDNAGQSLSEIHSLSGGVGIGKEQERTVYCVVLQKQSKVGKQKGHHCGGTKDTCADIQPAPS